MELRGSHRIASASELQSAKDNSCNDDDVPTRSPTRWCLVDELEKYAHYVAEEIPSDFQDFPLFSHWQRISAHFGNWLWDDDENHWPSPKFNNWIIFWPDYRANRCKFP